MPFPAPDLYPSDVIFPGEDSAAGYEPTSQFGALLIAYLWPWLTLHLAWVLDQAIGVVVDPVYTTVLDVGDDDGVTPTVGTYVNGALVTEGYQPGFGVFLNPQACPAGDLPYLAQFPGVVLPTGADEATSRSLIMEEAGLNRGTDSAVIAAAKRFLSGSQTVQLIPRTYVDGTPSAGHFVLVVDSAEVVSVSGLTAAVNAAKFGGLMWALVQTTGWTIDQVEADFSTITQVETTFASVTDVEGDVT
jgi:hypothetical protein